MNQAVSEFLQHREDFYKVLVDTSGDGIFVTSPEGECLHVNDTGHRMLGYGIGELQGQNIMEILHSDGLALLTSGVSGYRQYHVVLERTLLRKDGSTLNVELHAQRLYNGYLLLTMRDRSQQVIEENRHKELHSRFEKIASQVPGMVYQFRMRPDGTFSFPYCSDYVRKLYRVSPGQIRDDASPLLAMLHADDHEAVMDSIRRSAYTLQPWHHEYRVRFPSGEVRWSYGNALPELEEDGSILWHGFITDITDRKEAEEQKLLLEAQLIQAQKVESIGRLAGGVAHDFNNLLTSIIGFSELALLDLAEDSRTAENIRMVLDTANRGAALTGKLLAFARKKIINPEIVDLNGVVTQLVPMIERLLGVDIELRLNLSRELSTTLIDISSLEQLIMNLVVNARDAMPMGGSLCIETSDCMLGESYTEAYVDLLPGEYVMLSVRDTGQGIRPEVRERIFEPFFTTKPAGKGTGLGLATCFGIIKQAGGHIAVSSTPGEGSTFRVYLQKAGGRLSKPAEPAKLPAKRESAECSETILLVEDDPNILALASDTLSDLGYKVLIAPDGGRALEVADSHPGHIDLLLTDVMLPKLNGKKLAATLQLDRPDLQVLFTSGFTDDGIVHRGVLEPGVQFLSKPYSLRQLGDRVRVLLDQKAGQPLCPKQIPFRD